MRLASADAFGALLKFLMLVPMRREKAASMRWEDVNLATGVWQIPRAEDEKGCPERLTLPPFVLDVIKSLDRRSDYVFGARQNKPFIGFGGSMMLLREKLRKITEAESLKPVETFTLHDCRRLFSTRMNDAREDGGAGYNQPHLVEFLLGHSLGAISEIYCRAEYRAPLARRCNCGATISRR